MTHHVSGRAIARAGLAAVAAMAAPGLANAHHPMGGATPSTLMEGLLSGLGHPVLGPDHLAFIVGIALLMAASRRWASLPLVFVALLVPGVLAHGAGIAIGPAELYVALSVLLIGLALLVEPRLPSIAGTAAVALAGFCHGYAFGETIVGAEATPLLAYLAGLSVALMVLTAVIAYAARSIFAGETAPASLRLAAGAVLVAAGGALTMAGMAA